MTPRQVKDAILSKLSGSIASIDSTWSNRNNVAWPNKVFDPNNAPKSGWIRPLIRFTYTDEGEKGERGIGVRNGLFAVENFTPSNTGVNKSGAIASVIEYLFGARTVNSVNFGQPMSTERGDDGNGWYCTITRVPFHVFTND